MDMDHLSLSLDSTKKSPPKNVQDSLLPDNNFLEEDKKIHNLNQQQILIAKSSNDNEVQNNNGIWNQLANAKQAIKSRLKSPSTTSCLQHNNQNISPQDNKFLENQNKNQKQTIRPEINSPPKDTTKTEEEVTSATPLDLWTNSKSSTIYNNDCEHSENKAEAELGVATNDNYCPKLSVAPVNTSWNKILKCFSVFKPKKISSPGPSESNKLQLQEVQAPKLKRNMTTEADFYLYELASNSEILDFQSTKNLGKHLPPRAIGYSWEKTFSSITDGFSLNNLYRKVEGIDSPVLFVIEDIEGRVFGAMLSCAFKVSENFYGNSDTFLFRCNPNFEVFKWSGDNFYFIQGQMNFISVGSDDGRYGLWLDDNLYMGRTETCSTFNSPPLVPEKDFKIKTVECWTVTLV